MRSQYTAWYVKAAATGFRHWRGARRTLKLVLGRLGVASSGEEVVADTTSGGETEGERDAGLGHGCLRFDGGLMKR